MATAAKQLASPFVSRERAGGLDLGPVPRPLSPGCLPIGSLWTVRTTLVSSEESAPFSQAPTLRYPAPLRSSAGQAPRKSKGDLQVEAWRVALGWRPALTCDRASRLVASRSHPSPQEGPTSSLPRTIHSYLEECRQGVSYFPPGGEHVWCAEWLSHVRMNGPGAPCAGKGRGERERLIAFPAHTNAPPEVSHTVCVCSSLPVGPGCPSSHAR